MASAAIGVLGIIVALAMINVESILDAWWKLSSIFSGGMLGLFLLGFISKRARNIDAALGTICGVILIGWISAAEFIGLPPTGILRISRHRLWHNRDIPLCGIHIGTPL